VQTEFHMNVPFEVCLMISLAIGAGDALRYPTLRRHVVWSLILVVPLSASPLLLPCCAAVRLSPLGLSGELLVAILLAWVARLAFS